jgi:hypothetical protein
VSFVYDRAPGKYVIYEVENGALKCGDYGVPLQRDENINRALMKISDLFAVSPKLAKKYNSHRAFGIRHWCRGDREAAVQALDATFEMMHRAFTRRARLLYLSGTSLTIVCTSIAVGITEYFGATALKMWCLVWLFGSLGAFVSVALRGQPPTLDVLEDRKATVAYGIVRTVVAMVFASLMYLLVLGGILVPELARESTARLLVLAFVAGFSEKPVPEAVIHHAISH